MACLPVGVSPRPAQDRKGGNDLMRVTGTAREQSPTEETTDPFIFPVAGPS